MFKVKFDQKALDKSESDVKELFKKVINSKALLKEVGDTVITDIKFQTKRGKSIPKDLQPFKPLSKSWRKEREKLSKYNKTSEVYSKNRSNLSFTGQLLDSLTYVANAGKILLKFTGIHKAYDFEYLTYYVRRKKTRRTANNKTVKGFANNGNLVFVNTNRSGIGKTGEDIPNSELAKYVQEDRPFLGVRDQIKERIKLTVLKYLRRSSRVFKVLNK